MRISKREYNKALKVVKAYEAQKAVPTKRRGKYSLLYLLDEDGDEDFRERLIQASSPHAAVNKFLRNAPKSLRWVDEDLEMDNQNYYVGDHPGLLEYL